MKDVRINVDRLRELFNIAHNALTDYSGCVTDNDVTLQLQRALEEIELELNDLIHSAPEID